MLLRPNAKINIGLNIVSKRADGYHNLETIFFPVGITDKLEIRRSNLHQSLRFSIGGAIRLDCQNNDNLIVRTYNLFAQQYGIKGVDISFEKHIPFGAGLGGGSSDAAHTAVALNEIFRLKLSSTELKQLVAQLGADCPFFIENKPCFAEGIGDILEPVNIDLSEYALLLIKPEIHVSTKQAYAHVKPQKPCQSLKELIKLPISEWRDKIKNDFEYSVFSQYPQLDEIKQMLYELGACYASMSGSGSSIYGLFSRSKLLQLKAEGSADIQLRLKHKNLSAMVFFDDAFGKR